MSRQSDPDDPATPAPATGSNEAAAAPEPAKARENADEAPQPAEPAAPSPEARVAELEARAGELMTQVNELNDRLLRALAEMDNIRKRAERDMTETAKYAISRFAHDVVGVSDNFQRAIASVPAEAVEQNAALKSLLEGVTVTEREFLNVLERHGVKRIELKGEPFDPRFHQAVQERRNPEVAAGTVLDVLQAGYIIGDRVLRAAMVIVATGGPRPAKPAAAKSEPVKTEAAKAEPVKAKTANAERGKEETAKAEPVKAETAKAETEGQRPQEPPADAAGTRPAGNGDKESGAANNNTPPQKGG